MIVYQNHGIVVRGIHTVAHIAQQKYSEVPDHLSITQLVVIHRHGDRSQISREIGPSFPETSDIKDIWNAKLPIKTTMQKMAAAAHIPHEEFHANELKNLIYTGWDEKNIPYGHLTELGANQLINFGKELRRRYLGTVLLPDDGNQDISSLLYCRSTNFCRTMQSLRSLLSGLLEIDDTHYPPSAKHTKNKGLLPTILSRAKHEETMFPNADGPCQAMMERRTEIFSDNLMETSIPGYLELEQKMKDILGYTDSVKWLPIKEILTCYEAHSLPFPEGITESDADRVTDLAGWMWGSLYQDDKLNRLAIGRFIRELLDVVHPAVHKLPIPSPSSPASFLPFTPSSPSASSSLSIPSISNKENSETENKINSKISNNMNSKIDNVIDSIDTFKEDQPINSQTPTDPLSRSENTQEHTHAKIMIFSGHDSTLVPILCALGIYDGVWPPYSSYLSIEIAESSVDSSSKFVRAIYNDKEMVIVGSVGGSVWCPYELFHSRLEEMSMTHSEYAESCSTCAVDGGVLVDDDIKATMGEK